jgi:hypothetical protein
MTDLPPIGKPLKTGGPHIGAPHNRHLAEIKNRCPGVREVDKSPAGGEGED